MKRAFLFIGLISLNSFAEYQYTQISTSRTTDANSYSSNWLELEFKTSEKTLFQASGSRSLDDGYRTTYLEGGFGYDFTKELSFYLDTSYYKNSYRLKGKGISGGGSFDLGHYLESKKSTSLSFNFGASFYHSVITSNDETTINDYSQKYLGCGIDQEITPYLSIGIAARVYTYNDQSTNSSTSQGYSSSLETSKTIVENSEEITETEETLNEEEELFEEELLEDDTTGIQDAEDGAPGPRIHSVNFFDSNTSESPKLERSISFSIYPPFAEWADFYLSYEKTDYRGDKRPTHDYVFKPRLKFENLTVGLKYSISKSAEKRDYYFTPSLSYWF